MKNNSIVFVILGFLLLSSQIVFAEYVGFDKGNEFFVTPIYGAISVSCNDHGQSSSSGYMCRGYLFGPSWSASIITDFDVDADHVSLACVREDGSKKDKTEKFNSKKRKSGEFNLWVRSLFQSPLLGYGSNKIHYELTKEDKSVLSGDFTAQVHKNDSRECSRGYFHSSNLNDCYNPGSFCSEYFYLKNYCK